MGERPWQKAHARVLLDGAVGAIAVLAAVFLRYEFDFSRLTVGGTLALAAAFGGLVAAAGTVAGLYKNRWKVGSFEELGHLVMANGAALVAILAAELVVSEWRPYLPFGAVFICSGFSVIAMGGVRYLWRAREEWRRERAAIGGRAVIVAGAGEAGEQIVRSLRAHPENGRRPMAFLDDDARKRNFEFLGVRLLGRLDELAEVAARTQAEELLIAIPSADGELVNRLTERAESLGLAVAVLPSSLELVGQGGQVDVQDIRKVSIVDLLGREPIDRHLVDVAGYVLGRRVLVTGAGGSIGTELCRQLQRLNPRQILLFDHDESNLHGLQLELRGRALLDTPELVIGDVRDRARLDDVFRRYRPEVVFHVAAHKHLPLLEMHPCEAVKTNVVGTLNVALAAGNAGCTHFINVSTDKAAEPSSVLGATKRVAELLCQNLRDDVESTVYTSVRFGNVLGSRGSIVPVFERQIAAGGPVTITHPEATRYFMTVPEAAQLVIHAGALAKGGEIFVLDMGEPVRILDLANRMLDLAGCRGTVRISYTGLRPGEKLHERLFFDDELERSDERVEDRIWQCSPGPLPPGFEHQLRTLCDHAFAEDEVGVLGSLSAIVPGYRRSDEAPLLGDLYPDGL